VSFGAGLGNAVFGDVGEIGLNIVRGVGDVIDNTVKFGPEVVKIKVKNITIRFVNVGESLVETGI